MRTRKLLSWALAAAVIAGPQIAHAQTLTNPDISAIGDMRYFYRDNVGAELAGADNVSFEFTELEVAVTAYLNPYARGDVYVAIHGVEGPIEIEEAYATVLRGIPVQLTFGKRFLDIGKINTEHSHQWPWYDYPLMLQSFFGEDGARAVGLGASKLIGVGDTALTLSASAFRSDLIGAHEHEPDETGDEPTKIGYSGRLSLFRELGDVTFLEVGASYMNATPSKDENLNAQVAAADVTFKWRPDTYKGIKVRLEAMYSDREVHTDTLGTVGDVKASGGFGSAEFRFRRRWDTGGFVDFAESAVEDGKNTTAWGLFFGFMPVEETARFSAVFRSEESDFYDGTNNSITFQVLWSIGPHKPHAF